MKRRMFEKKEFHKLSFVLELDCVQNRWLINHMLCYFSHSHNNYGRDPHSDLNSLPPERQRLANQKLGIFTILCNSSLFTELNFGFASVTIWYLAPCQILEVANQRRVLAAKTICCPLCWDEYCLSTCAFITFHQTSGVFLFVFPIHKIFQHFLMALLFLSTLCTSPTGCCLREKKRWDGVSINSLVPHPGHPVSWETRLGIESFCFEETKQNCVLSKFVQSDFLHTNKTIGDEGITVDFWTIKVHTPNWPSNSWGSSNSWEYQIVGDHRIGSLKSIL